MTTATSTSMAASAGVSYELTPAVKPFVEVEGDSRVHDLPLDRNGYARDSTGGYAKAGTSFEFTRLLTGEISVGYAARDYVDPRLDRLQGLLTAASLTWTATPLTTAKFYLHHLDRRDHAARRLRRADASLHRRSRSRFPPLADRRSANSPTARWTTRATDGSTRSTRSRAT